MRCYRVMIAEDNAAQATELREKLQAETEIDMVGVARNGVEACEMARRHAPDVILMDIDMPQMNGIQATRLIKQEAPGTEIVILTIFDDTPHLFAAIRAGAMGYLIKGCTTEEIVGAVKAVASGEGSLPPAQVRFVLAEFDRLEQQAAALRTLYETLSKTEIAVLSHVAQGKTNPQIAQLLSTEVATVRNHLSAILKKLQVNSRVEAALIADRTGLTASR